MRDRFGHYKTSHPVTFEEQTVQFNAPVKKTKKKKRKKLIKDVVTSICVIVSFVMSDLSDAQHSFCALLPANKNLSQTSHRNRVITVCKQFENTDDTAPISVR